MKYIFVTGGVVSGLGKGICAASLGRLLKQCGLRVRNQKFDPYLNVDPGTMSPYQHGEVFVTDDGAETDLDLGHYERFVDEALDANSSVSSGKIYWSVLNRERQGGYLGGTVQIIPHVTDEIKNRIYAMDDGQTDVVISEIGGTVGDIESQPFLEAIRQVAAEKGKENVLYIHVPLIVSIPGSGELKSKPTQHSVKELLSIGIQPDILVCRTDSPITGDIRRKIALFCNVEEDCVIPNVTASTLYEAPLLLEKAGLCRVVCRKLGLGSGVAYAGVFLVNTEPEGDAMASYFLGQVAGALIGLPFLSGETDFSFVPMVCIFALGVFQLGLSYVLIARGIATTPPMTASLVTAIEPILTPVWVALAYGERLSGFSLAGAVLVLCSVVWFNTRGRKAL